VRIVLLANALSTHTQRWARAYADVGDDVHVVSIRNARIEGARVHCIRVGTENNHRTLPTLLSYARLLVAARRTMRRIAPDVIHAHYSVTHGTIAWVTRAHPVVVSVWGTDVHPAPRRLVRGVLDRLNRAALRHADRVTATSEYLATRVADLTGGSVRATVVPFGVDPAHFPVTQRRRAAPVTFGFVKQLRARYRPDLPVAALARLAAEGMDCRLIVVGDGPLRREVATQIRSLELGSRVTLRGRIDHDRLPELLSQIDVLVNPSSEESFGVILVEAAASGIPSVAAAVGGVPEVVLDGRTGLLVPADDLPALTDAMRRLADDPALRERLGRASAERARQRFAWQGNVDAMRRVLRGAMEAP
jgi:glycosyltransferase involved in cell wall biosynthesis